MKCLVELYTCRKITMFRYMKNISHNRCRYYKYFYRKKGVIGIDSTDLEGFDKSKHGRHIYNEHYDNKVSIFNDTSFVGPKVRSITNS